MTRTAICGLTVMALLTGVARADDWAAPGVRNVFSENGRFFVRLVPGTSIGDSVGFAGAPKGPYARGVFYARQADRSYKLVADAELQNPVSPVDAMVTNAGYLITFDNWHNVGYGKAVAIYRPNGELVRAFEIEEIYSADNAKRIPRSVSSRWWRCSPTGYVDPDQQMQVFVRDTSAASSSSMFGPGNTGMSAVQPSASRHSLQETSAGPFNVTAASDPHGQAATEGV